MPRPPCEAGGETVIVSSDKDLMQLIGPGVSMLDPMKNLPIGLAEVEAKFGVTPDKVIEVQALIGDSVDNVPGVPGIGPKGAAQLINEYGTVEAVLEAAPPMKPSKRRDMLIEHADKARISKQLVTLRADAPLPEPLENFVLRRWDDAVLSAFLDQNTFKSIKHRWRWSTRRSRKPRWRRSSAAPFGGYATVTTRKALEELIAEARRGGKLALDMQTDNHLSLHGNLVGIALAVAPGRAAYVPLGHNLGLEDTPQLNMATVLGALAPSARRSCRDEDLLRREISAGSADPGRPWRRGADRRRDADLLCAGCRQFRA